MLGWLLNLGFAAGPAAVSAPVFAGIIPDITATFGDSDAVTDLSTYFTGATSYAIAPAVETGWTFNTSTGVLTVDTDEANTFGPYTVTGTNAGGDTASNAFGVTISELASTGGSWSPPKKVTTKLKKKDDSVLESIYELVAKLEEVPAPAKLKERVKKVEVRAKKVINLNSIKEHDKQIKLVSKQIQLLEKSVNIHIKKAKQDEDDAINALLSII